MTEQVSLQDVGDAESVLSRLLQERRSLETVERVLQTYRMVKGQLQPALDELEEVKKDIEVARGELASVNAKFDAECSQAEKDVKEYRDELVGRVNTELNDLEEQREKQQSEYDKWASAASKTRQSYAEEIEGYSKQLEEVKGELEKVKKDHAVLAEAISRASQHFTVR